MIQRKQTLYLLVITVVAALLMNVDPAFYEESGKVKIENAELAAVDVDVHFTNTRIDGKEIAQNKGIFIILIAIGLVAFVTIFLFKNRKMQLYLILLNYILILALFANMYWYSLNMGYADTEITKSFLPAAVSPVSFLLFNFLARRGIVHDEKLVRSLDRLR